MSHSIFSPRYWLLKLQILFFRTLVNFQRGIQTYLRSRPLPPGITREVLTIPSRDKGRGIGVDLYSPSSSSPSSKLPVVVNWHGSGYVFPSWGEDREFITQAVTSLQCIVLDCDYRKGPEHIYPSAHDDAQDVLGWLFSHPDKFDLSKVALTGFSAGAALALCTANLFGPKKIKALSALYPPIEVKAHTEYPRLNRPFRSGLVLTPAIVALFHKAYTPNTSVFAEPRFSIKGLDTRRFPDHIFIATGEADILHDSAKRYFEEVKKREKGKRVSWMSVEKEEHAWDKKPLVKESEEARDEAYRRMIENLREGFNA